MEFTKLNSSHSIFVNCSKYKIDWDRKVSKPQKYVKDFLYQFWKDDSVYEELIIPGSKKRIDLLNYSKSIIIEVSPDSIHTKYNDFMHKTRSLFLVKLKTDNSKMEWAERNGYKFISLNDEDIKNISVDYFLNKFNINLLY